MKSQTWIFVSLLAVLLCSSSLALKVERSGATHMDEQVKKDAVTSVENPDSNNSCSKQFCMQKFGLLPDPFDPHCYENATCWQEWYGFPKCKDDDIKCWKVAVGYPKECQDNDYDCWIKSFGYSNCQDATCLKEYLNMSCKSDDIECWKTKTWTSSCKWDDWDCWVQNSFMQYICGQKKGYDCVSQYYSNPCKKDDEECWRKTFNIPSKDCEKDVDCFKKFYYLPTCKDDDFDCWKKNYYGPDCKKGDMNCLKKFLSIPDCHSQKDEVQCYKKWLQYPDCKIDDGKCWKDWNDSKNTYSGAMFWSVTYDHKKTQSHKPMSFGQMMQHRRTSMSQMHKLNRQFHMKRAGLMK